ncbi:MAG TPA: DUF3105 domain-containing protein [Solirubrobacter sp.]|nr:DUF3105 domain-containing protein [Solirubrobacter sp.]
MSSRQEEKERRKRERQERAAAEKASAARRKRLQMVFGGVIAALAVVAVVVVVVVVAGGGGDDPATEVSASAAAIPEVKETDLKKAAAAAGCKIVDAPNEGAGHEEKDFKPSDYKQNPPTSGTHFPEWYQDGVYNPGDTPNLGMLVHTLEHGRIDVQYKPGTPKTTVAQLETLLKESDDGYHMLLFENTTKMPFQIAATAWDHQLGCPTMNDKVFDAIRTFRTAHIDKGPEIVP